MKHEVSAYLMLACIGLYAFAVIMVLIYVGQDVRRKRLKHRLYDYSAE